MRPMQRLVLLLLASFFAASAFAQSAAIKGYDPVAYFEPGRPTMGSPSISYEFDGRRYLFSSQKNRERFVSNPDRYEPQFNGLCAAGLADGRIIEPDPTAFVVRDGKLYLFQGQKGVERVKADPSLLSKAHQAHQNARK
jgi:YHS domain-containing protein